MQMSLPIYTELELVIAEQIAWSKARDEANDQDLAEAVETAERWNSKRKALGLRVLT